MHECEINYMGHKALWIFSLVDSSETQTRCLRTTDPPTLRLHFKVLSSLSELISRGDNILWGIRWNMRRNISMGCFNEPGYLVFSGWGGCLSASRKLYSPERANLNLMLGIGLMMSRLWMAPMLQCYNCCITCRQWALLWCVCCHHTLHTTHYRPPSSRYCSSSRS